jgi:hypothetical protein
VLLKFCVGEYVAKIHAIQHVFRLDTSPEQFFDAFPRASPVQPREGFKREIRACASLLEILPYSRRLSHDAQQSLVLLQCIENIAVSHHRVQHEVGKVCDASKTNTRQKLLLLRRNVSTGVFFGIFFGLLQRLKLWCRPGCVPPSSMSRTTAGEAKAAHCAEAVSVAHVMTRRVSICNALEVLGDFAPRVAMMHLGNVQKDVHELKSRRQELSRNGHVVLSFATSVLACM